MRLTRFLYEGDNIQKGLSIGEPEVGEDYSDEEVKKNITAIKDAIAAQKSKGTESDADESIMKDLEDKLDKWENVDSETKAAGPVVPAVDVLAATAEPAGGEGGESAPAKKAPPKEEKPKEDKKKKKEKKDEEK